MFAMLYINCGLCWQVMGTFDDHPTSCEVLVSPMLAPDDVLRELPPVSVVVSDAVMHTLHVMVKIHLVYA